MRELETILQKNFSLTKIENLPDEESLYLKMLQKKLAERIKFYINTDLDYLLQALYRIDVPQGQTESSFDLGEVDKVAMDLAEKIIRRQLQKIQYSKDFYGKEK